MVIHIVGYTIHSVTLHDAVGHSHVEIYGSVSECDIIFHDFFPQINIELPVSTSDL
jgi:hypothetical protein